MSPVPPAIRDHTLGPSVCNVHPHLPECPALVSVTSDSALRLNFTDGLNPDINPKTVAGAVLSPPQTQEAFGLEVASGPVCPALTPELVSTTTRTLPPGRTQSRANQVHTGKSCLFTFCLRTGTAGEESPPPPPSSSHCPPPRPCYYSWHSQGHTDGWSHSGRDPGASETQKPNSGPEWPGLALIVRQALASWGSSQGLCLLIYEVRQNHLPQGDKETGRKRPRDSRDGAEPKLISKHHLQALRP